MPDFFMSKPTTTTTTTTDRAVEVQGDLPGPWPVRQSCRGQCPLQLCFRGHGPRKSSCPHAAHTSPPLMPSGPQCVVVPHNEERAGVRAGNGQMPAAAAFFCIRSTQRPPASVHFSVLIERTLPCVHRSSHRSVHTRQVSSHDRTKVWTFPARFRTSVLLKA